MNRAAAVVLLMLSSGCVTSATPPVEVPMPAARVIHSAMNTYREYNIPMLEMTADAGRSNYLVSGWFDPREVWSPGEVNARVRCGDVAQPAADTLAELRLQINVRAMDATRDRWSDGRPMSASVADRFGRSRVALESSGDLHEAKNEHSCVIQRKFAAELLSRITGQNIARSAVADAQH